jgi:hypothetical protein
LRNKIEEINLKLDKSIDQYNSLVTQNQLNSANLKAAEEDLFKKNHEYLCLQKMFEELNQSSEEVRF